MAKDKKETKDVTVEDTVSQEEFIQRKLQVLNTIGDEKSKRAMQRIIAMNRKQGGKA